MVISFPSFSLYSEAILKVLSNAFALMSCKIIVDPSKKFDLNISPTTPNPKFVLPAPINTILCIVITFE